VFHSLDIQKIKVAWVFSIHGMHCAVLYCGRVLRHRQLQEPEVLTAVDDADTRRQRDEMSEEEEEEELDDEVCHAHSCYF